MLATGGDDSVIRIWEVSYNEEDLKVDKYHEFLNHTGPINGLDFHVLGELVINYWIFLCNFQIFFEYFSLSALPKIKHVGFTI